jgi:hypothetical protein
MSVFLENQSTGDRAAILAALQAEVVHLAWLIEFQFASGTIRASNEITAFEDANGATWQGLGTLIQAPVLTGGPGELAPLREYVMALPSEILEVGESGGGLGRIPELIGSPTEYRGRWVIFYGQLFSTSATDSSGRASPLGVPFALDRALMDRASLTYTGSEATITLQAESILSRKRAPLYGMLTPRDQKSRFSGDKGLDYVPEIATGTLVQWTSW